MWIVYLLQNSATSELYFGVTQNLKERIRQHNLGGRKYTTRKNGQWVLIYAEVYRSKDDALEREQKLKHHGSGKHELLKRVHKSMLGIPKLGLDAATDLK